MHYSESNVQNLYNSHITQYYCPFGESRFHPVTFPSRENGELHFQINQL